MTKLELETLHLTYALYYLDEQCDTSGTLTTLISLAKDLIMINPETKGCYNIRLYNLIIAVY